MEVCHFQLQGQRPYQEDSYMIDPKHRFFIVCDGMGGSTHGDLASQTIVESVQKQIGKEGKPYHSHSEIQELLQQAWQDLMEKFRQEPSRRGMGTTFVGVFFSDDGNYVAHVGDSRAYHIRPGESLLWCTKDHSVVQQLFEEGLFSSKKQMEEDPRSPKITRAFIATEERSAPKADIHKLKMVEEGDLIMLCSDGFVEAFKGDSHSMILTDREKKLEEKCNEIKAGCKARSKDNTTVILVQV